MYSMAQQAVPNGMGQSEFFRAQLATSLIRVVRKFSLRVAWLPIFSSIQRRLINGGIATYHESNLIYQLGRSQIFTPLNSHKEIHTLSDKSLLVSPPLGWFTACEGVNLQVEVMVVN
jgi:hypothetical protein